MTHLSSLMKATKAFHDKIDSHPFTSRYAKKTVTLLDRYRHLVQLAAIYEALEKRLKEKNFLALLPEKFGELFNRTEKIKADLVFLEKYIPPVHRTEKLIQQTKDYVAYIEHLDQDTEQGSLNSELFAHFLVRIFGDLFGGKSTREFSIHLHLQENIYSAKNPEQGVSFYNFSPNMLKDFLNWFNDQNMDMQKINPAANTAFEKHELIFDELEKTRVPFSRSRYNCIEFFKSHQKVILATTAVVTAAISVALSS